MKLLLTLFICLLLTRPSIAAEGMVDVASNYSVEQTAQRLESILEEKGMTFSSE